jgi:threonine/homoserine/homoserine lactone efflux protein
VGDGLEHLALFFRGIGIGILFSVPVGPVNVMCIREAFQFGFRIGLAASFGAVTADVTFAAFAAFGLTVIADLVEGHALSFQVLAAVVLIYIGQKVARSHAAIDLDAEPMSARRAALSGFGMTATNPTTILAFIAVFASLGPLAPDVGDYVGTLFLVAGVAAGGFGWWFLLVSLIAMVRRRMTVGALVAINHAAGAILALFGLGLLARVLWVVLR